jgi:transposase
MAMRSFEMYQYRHIITQMRLGQSDRAIAKAGLAGRDKCHQIRQLALKQGWLDAANPLPDDAALAKTFTTTSQPRKSLPLVTPYAKEITAWHRQGIAGSTIYSALVRKYNYTGAYDSVKRFVHKLNVAEGVSQASAVLSFKPAEAAQLDFGKGPEIVDKASGEIISTWFFVMTLCFSRHQYVEVVRDQRTDTWLGCHRRAFEFFGGVPAKLIIDNAKCAITKACYYDPQVQRAYADCAEGYGFIISPCPPREPQLKGRVESGVKYVKRNFLPLREFRSLADANQQARSWILETAGNRIHGTTQAKPLTLFTDTEQHLLKPLPVEAPELSVWAQAKVHGDCHVQYEKRRYSVPYQHVHQTVWLRVSEQCVRIYLHHELIALHTKLKLPGQRATLDGHLPPNATAYLMQDPTWCREQARTIGSHCRQVIDHLFADKVLDNLRTAQGIIGLAKTYGKLRLNAACKRAKVFNSLRYMTIKTILKQGLEYAPLPETHAFDLLGKAYTKGRFIRQTQLTH